MPKTTNTKGKPDSEVWVKVSVTKTVHKGLKMKAIQSGLAYLPYIVQVLKTAAESK